MDTILVDNGLIIQVWRDTPSSDVQPPPTGSLHEVSVATNAICGMSFVNGAIGPPPPEPIDPSLLRAHADLLLRQVSDAGAIATLASGTTVSISTDADGKADVVGLHLLAQMAGAGWSTVWYQSTGSITIDASDLHVISTALSAHREGVFMHWRRAVAGINAGTITTTAQIDAIFAAP